MFKIIFLGVCVCVAGRWVVILVGGLVGGLAMSLVVYFI